MTQLVGPFSSGVADGVYGYDGEALSDLDSDVRLVGVIKAIGVHFSENISTSNTVVVTMLGDGDNVPPRTLLSLDSETTDKWYEPRELIQDTDGADIADTYGNGLAVAGRINIALDQANIGDEVFVSLILE